MRAEVLIARDDEDAALDDIAKALTLARKSDDPFRLLQALAHTIRLYVALRQFDRAQALAEEVRSHRPDVVARYVLPTLALHKEVLGLTDDDLEAYLEHLLPELAEAEVCRLIVAGDFERLADLMAQRENPQFEAEVRMQAVKQLLGKGRHEDAAAQADKALSFYRSVGATRYIREAEELLTVTNAAGEQRPI